MRKAPVNMFCICIVHMTFLFHSVCPLCLKNYNHFFKIFLTILLQSFLYEYASCTLHFYPILHILLATVLGILLIKFFLITCAYVYF